MLALTPDDAKTIAIVATTVLVDASAADTQCSVVGVTITISDPRAGDASSASS